MDSIKLNFFPLTEQNFNIRIYRKKTEETHLKSKTGSRFKLKPNNSNKYEQFDVNWDPLNGYDEYSCEAAENFDLTKQYILKALELKLASAGCQFEYYSPTKSFYKELRFITQKYEEGQTEIRLQPYYLKSNKQFGFLAIHHFKIKDEQEFNRKVQKLSLSLDDHYQQNKSYYSDKYKLISAFVESVVPQLGEIIPKVELSSQMADMYVDQLATKKYIVGNKRVSNSQYVGIKQNGPYSLVSDPVKYIFVFPEPLRTLARDVYSGLDGKLFSGLFSGLEEMFKLSFKKENVCHLLVERYDDKTINQISQTAIKMQDENRYRVCVIIFLPANITEEDNQRTYSHLKLEAIQNDFYTQVIRQETMGKKEQLKWSIGNIGLQIFSKLGGVPWLMQPSHQKCLIFGIGSSHEIDADGNIERYTAYTVCIDTKGNFNKIKPLSSSKDHVEYLSTLKDELIKALSSSENNDINECVIHIPFKIRKDEIVAIRESVTEARKDLKFEIKIIKINTKHKFFGFSQHNTKVPYESSLVELSNSEYLVWTEGLQYGKSTLTRRISEPLHIQFLDGGHDDYDEAKTYLQDIINLTGANWRGFNSKAQPISIYYSKLIADFMKRFGKFEAVKDFSVLSQESFNPWFL